MMALDASNAHQWSGSTLWKTRLAKCSHCKHKASFKWEAVGMGGSQTLSPRFRVPGNERTVRVVIRDEILIRSLNVGFRF